MARPALSAARSIDIVDFLSAMPDSAFTMSQIARATGINVGSCHAILHELSERGYVVRDPTVKTYMLGPALVAMGNAAIRSQPLISRAQAAAQSLSREHGIPMSLARVIGHEVVIVFSVPGPGGLRPGTRLPLLPPIGAPFLAWSSEAAIADWLASRTDGTDELREQWTHALAQVRKWGYQVLQRSATPDTLPRLLAELSAGGRLSNYKHQVTDFVKASGEYFVQPREIESDALYEIVLISAPIFDPSGNSVFNLCIGDLGKKISGAQVQAYANELLQCCVDIMRTVNGI